MSIRIKENRPGIESLRQETQSQSNVMSFNPVTADVTMRTSIDTPTPADAYSLINQTLNVSDKDILAEQTGNDIVVDEEPVIFRNIAKDLSSEKLREIGRLVVDGYISDKQSRSKWEKDFEAYNRMFFCRPEFEQKNDPWPGAANVVLSLISTACINFQSRAMGAIFNTKQIVKVVSVDSSPEVIAAAGRREKYMNTNLTIRNKTYYQGMGKSLMQLPLSGCVVRKTYYDPITRMTNVDFVSPLDFVVHYKTRYLSDSRRYTHVYSEAISDVKYKQDSGFYLKPESYLPDTESANDKEGLLQQSENHGITPNKQELNKDVATKNILEQYVYLSLNEGECKPYTVFVDQDSQEVLRIVEKEIFINGRIKRICEYSQYTFIPSPDDSFYGIGFGVLLLKSNEIANSIINNLLDAGTLANTQSGFVNKRAGLTRGQFQLKRGVWSEVEINTDDIRKAMMPVVFKEPSSVLYQLLGTIQEYANRLTTVTDIFTGAMPRSDTSATSYIKLIEEGQKVFGTIFRGIHVSLSQELQSIADFDEIYAGDEDYVEITTDIGGGRIGERRDIRREDFSYPMEIFPVSDPTITSRVEMIAQAEMIYNMVKSDPVLSQNIVSLYEAAHNYISKIETNKNIVDRIMNPVKDQVEQQLIAQQQAKQELIMKQQALDLYMQHLQAGGVPNELIALFAQQQQVGEQVMLAQQNQQQTQKQ